MAGADAAPVPVDPVAADQLFAPLLSYDHLALAVSGGSDSVALMLLASAWRQRQPRAPRLSVLTVDHGLRAEAANEAAQVSEWAHALGLDHATLKWRGAKPQSGLQDAARQARYELMADWCAKAGADAIVTGHTLDDQAETFLMRLGRGSGVDGLSAMAPHTRSPWPLLRPLLGVSRGQLRASLVAARHGWIDDPSNEDVEFERVRIRKALSVLERAGVTPGAIAQSASRLARARAALEEQVENLHGAAVSADEDGKLLVDLKSFGAAPCELRIRLVQRLVLQLGGQAFSKLSALERLDDWIMSGEGRARTLGNCRISRRKRALVVVREPTRTRGLGAAK